ISGIDSNLFTAEILPQVNGSDDTVVVITRKPGIDADHAAFEDAIEAVKFSNTSHNPDTTQRVVDVVVSDGTSDSNVATAKIDFSTVNDAPAVDLDGSEAGTGFTTSYAEQATPISIADSDMDVSDVDTEHLQRITIELTNPKTDDVLDKSGINTGQFDVNVSADGYTITLTPKAGQTPSHDDVETAIKAVTFSNTSDTPDTTPRTINVQVNDGALDSNVATTTINFSAVNDAPTVVVDINAITEGAAEPATGNVLTNDSDVEGDTLNVVGVARGNTGADLESAGTVGAGVAGDYGTVTIGADGAYSYVLDNGNAAVQALAVGETLTETFTYTASDGNGGVKHTTLTITINGANDAPVVAADANSVTEDAADATGHDDSNPNTSIVVGDVLANDSDIEGDGLSVVGVARGSQTNNLEDANTVGAGVAGDYGTVTIGTNGAYSYSLDNGNAAVQALADGETLTETFTYTASDGNGGVEHTTLTITINGTNDALAVISDTDSIVEDTAAPATGNVLTNDSDVDGDGLSVVGVARGSQTNNLEDANTVGVGVGVAGDYGTVTIGANGAYSYSLDNGNAAVQALADGETLTETFTYTASDGNGGVKHTTLEITINGVNDTPQITVAGADADSAAINETDAKLTATGTLSLADVDTSDNVTMSVNSVATGGGTYTGTLPSNAALKAMLTVSGGLDGSQSGNEHGVNWSFDSGSEYFNAIPTGKTVVLTYTVKADDGNGGTTTHDVTITITGTNDAPVVRADTNSVIEDVAPATVVGSVINGEDDGTPNDAMKDTDADHGDTLRVTGIATGTTAAGSDNVNANTNAATGTAVTGTCGTLKIGADGSYSYELDNSLDVVQNLAKNQSAADTFTYTVKDSQGASQSTTLTINVNGTNDAPVITKGGSDSDTAEHDETSNQIQLNGTLSIADEDTTDTVTMSVASVSTTAADILGTESYPFGGDEAGFNTKLMEMLTFTNDQVLGDTQTAIAGGIAWNFTTKVGTTYPFDFVPPGDDFVITYTVKATDSSGQGNTASGGNEIDNDTHTITITIHGTNDTGILSAETVSTNEDTELSGNVFANATQDPDAGQELAVTTFTIDGAGPYDAGVSVDVTSGANTIGTLVLNADGSYTFDPEQHYSGPVPQITYAATSGGADVGNSTLGITVNPVSDLPGMGNAYSIDGINEDTSVALASGTGAAQWKLPTITDNVDQNGVATGGDWSERLGLLKLSGVPVGATITSDDGISHVVQSTSDILIKIVADDGSAYTSNGKPYHTAEAQAANATLTLTKAQFDALQIQPPTNSSKDLKLTLTATEYEVNADGTIYEPTSGNDIAGATSTQDITIAVVPVADDNFTLTAGTVPSDKNEDSEISLQNAFNFARATGQDDSEHYRLQFACDNESRVELKFNGTDGWLSVSDFNDKNYDFTGDLFPDVKIRTIGNDSRDITGLNLTLAAVDYDDDQNDNTTAVSGNSTTVNLGNIVISPVANDITLKPGGATGNEDTKIAMGLDFVNADGSGATGQEKVGHLVISGIPTGVRIFKADETELTDGTQTSYDTSTASLTIADIKALTLLPPQDFSGKIDLGVKVYSKDYDDDTPGQGEAATQNPTEVTHTITVNGVVDTSATGADQWTEGTAELTQDNGTYQGNLYVTHDGAELKGDATVTPVSGTEDNSVALELNWNNYESQQHSTGDNSETAEFIIRAGEGETNSFTIVNGSGDAIGTQVSGGWKLTLAELQNAHVKAQKDFSGNLNLELETKVTDGTDEKTQVDKFQVQLAPETDIPTLQLTGVYATEDTPAKFDVYPQTSDSDGSEDVTKVEITVIPKGVTFSIGASGGQSRTTTTENEAITLTISNTTNLAQGKITQADLQNLYITAPPESNTDFKVHVKAFVQDPDTTGGGQHGTEVATDEKVVDVWVKGDADDLVRTDRTTGTTEITANEPQSGGGLVDIHNLGFTSGETQSGQAADDDNSETLTYILKNLPKEFLLTDADGNLIGDFIATDGSTVNWSFTQAQMDGLQIKVPQYYSGTSQMTLEAIAVENDGDTATASRNFSLVVSPIVSTLDPVEPNAYTIKEPVTVHANSNLGEDTKTTADTFVPLVFTNTTDGEEVTKVEISTVPTGVVLGINNGGTITEGTPGGNGKYTFTGNDIGKIVAIIKGAGSNSNQTHSNDGTQLTINDIQVTVVDTKDDEATVTAEKTINGGTITLTVEGQADQPDITGLIVNNPQTSSYYNEVKVTTAFPDTDGESHYFIVSAPEEVLLGSGEHQGGGNWYLTEAEAASFNAWFHGPSTLTKDITITAYAAENTLAQDEIVATISGSQEDDGTQTKYTAQTPLLTVNSPTPNEDTSFTLAQVVNDAQLTNNDEGSEKLSIVIKGLDLSVTGPVQSIVGASQYSYDDNGVTKTAYQIDPDKLANVIITPKEDYSGPVTFTVEAVAYETKAADKDHRVATTSKEVTVNVQPKAETELTVTPEGDLVDGINEDARPLVKLALSNEDASNPETFDAPDTARLSVDNGEFVDGDGNSLGKNLINLTYDSTNHTFTTSEGAPVYYQPLSHDDGDFTITVTAQARDSTTTATDTFNVSQNITVDIIPIANGGTFTLTDGAAPNPNPVSTEDKLVVNEDGTVKLDIHSDFHDDDDSEFQTILIENVPAGMLFYNASNQLVGEINAVGGDGKSTWKLPAGSAPDGVMNGNLYIKPPLHYTDDITLKVVGISMEGGAMGTQVSHEASFTLDITPVANGVTLFPQNASGEEDLPIHIDLGAKLIAQEETDTVGLNHTINETYNVTFANASDEIILFWKDDGDHYHTLPNADGTGTDYKVTGLNQTQIDHLYVQVEGNRAGSFEWNIAVSSSEGTSTSTPETATVGVVASYEYDSQTNPAPGQTITIDDKTHIFAQSGNDTITGTDAVEIIDGGKGRDTLDGGVGADELYGGKGDDTIVFDPSDTTIDGGDGEDTLKVESDQDFTGLASDLISDMEIIDLTTGSQQITLDPAHVKAMSGNNNHELLVKGDNQDAVNISGWTQDSDATIDGTLYHVFESDGAILKIEDGISYHIA
ncbi:MAG: hypothetical protein CSA50_00100, partial [Gammaproteobacteria bacterium]